MTLIMDLDGITVKLKIWNYRPSSEVDWTADWCKTDFSFTAEPWLNYHMEEDEVFLSCELEELYDALGLLLSGEMTERTEMDMMEPDFSFVLHPRREQREDPRPLRDRGEYETEDICVDWKVSFWHDGLTKNYLSVRLNREDIEQLRNYLAIVIGR